MPVIEEIVYNNRDNTIALQLSVDGVTVTHSNLTRVQVQVGATLLDSNVTPALFDLTQTDRLSLKFGSAGLTAGRYSATLYIYDEIHTNGLHFGEFVIAVK